MIETSNELIKRLNELKKHTFFELLDLVGRVFIIVDYDDSVMIGKRGFLPEEKERGLVLVFNQKMKFIWEDDAITATLVFGNNPEKCYIPVNAITGVFSPDLRIQLSVPFLKEIKKEDETKESLSSQSNFENKGKVVDITKIRKKK